MANAGNVGGIWMGTEAGVVTTKLVYVEAIIFYCLTGGHTCVIKEGTNTTQILPTLGSASNTTTVVVNFDRKRFPKGLFISSISSGSMVGIVFKDDLLPA